MPREISIRFATVRAHTTLIESSIRKACERRLFDTASIDRAFLGQLVKDMLAELPLRATAVRVGDCRPGDEPDSMWITLLFDLPPEIVTIHFTTARVVTIRFTSERAVAALIITALQRYPDIYSQLMGSLLKGKAASDHTLI